ncbi:MAG: hypothetical protein AB7G37_14880 [Solirubrobacteraceae bacterium]
MPATSSHRRTRSRSALAAAASVVVLGLAGAPVAAADDGATGGSTAPVTDGSESGATSGAVPDTVTVDDSTPALTRARDALAAASPDDLWSVADAVSTAVDPQWNPTTGAYEINGSPRARLNAEMLIAHATAAAAGRSRASARTDRIAPLVRLLTQRMYLATLDGHITPVVEPGRSVTQHAPGFADAAGNPATMHQGLDAVAMRALAAAWRARDAANLSPQVRELIRTRVTAVATSPFWRYPSRLLNQINWNADVYAAYHTVTGDPTLLREDYRRQLIWFADHARRNAYAGGAPNLASGLGFHYLPQRPRSNQANTLDTAEYASITHGALAYYDQAVAAGMELPPAATRSLLRRWTQRIAYGNWTASGYLNWDSGRGVQRLHLTQYWLLALRGFAAGLGGSDSAGFLTDQRETARGLVREAVQLYQRRAADAGSAVLPATAFGFSGSALVSEGFDGLTGTARFAATLSELADDGLGADAGGVSALPTAVAHDQTLGRLAVTTSRYSSAILKPFKRLRNGGLEPDRIIDAAGRPLTGVGGSENGSLGLRLSSRGRTLVETQPGRPRSKQSSLRVPKATKDSSRLLRGALSVSGTDAAEGIDVTVRHAISRTGIKTTYTIVNRRTKKVTADLRVPTYGPGDGGTWSIGDRVSRSSLQRTQRITAPSGGTFRLRFRGLPRTAKGRVIRAAGRRIGPKPGPQLRVRTTLPKGTTKITRVLTFPLAR